MEKEENLLEEREEDELEEKEEDQTPQLSQKVSACGLFFSTTYQGISVVVTGAGPPANQCM